MTQDDAQKLVDDAIDQLIANDSVLLELGANERSLSHQLAHYMALSPLVLKPLSVDCEYNRRGANTKELRGIKRSDLGLDKRYPTDEDIHATTVFPDIVVHERNTDRCNFIVLELKKPNRNIDDDKKKLQAFKSQLNYLHAAHVILGMNKQGELVRKVWWITNPSETSTAELAN